MPVAAPGEPGAGVPSWDSRGHFFAAAGEAMRRILVESARRKKRLEHGGELTRRELADIPLELPDVHEASCWSMRPSTA